MSRVVEAGLKPGDTVVALNHIRLNPVHEKMTTRYDMIQSQPTNNMVEEPKKKSWREFIKWGGASGGESGSGSDGGVNSKKAAEIREGEPVTPDLVAKVTGAKKPVRQAVHSSIIDRYGVGGGALGGMDMSREELMQAVLGMMHNRGAGGESIFNRPRPQLEADPEMV